MLIHLDTDIGGDMDDLCALAMCLRWPGAEISAVTTVCDAGGRRAGYARYALALEGRSQIPLAAGADVDCGRFRVVPTYPVEADYWPETVPPAPGPLDAALELLKTSIEQGAAVAALGPYTNLYLLEQKYPGILRRARLFLMGGFLTPARAGFPGWGNDMDWNIQQDAAAAEYVLTHSHPTLIPMTVSLETSLRRAYLPRLRAAGALGALIARQAEAFAREYENETRLGQTCAGLPDDTINFQHDPLACAVALGWTEGMTTAEIGLILEWKDGWLHERGVETGAPGSTPARIVTRIDGDRLNRLWLDCLTGSLAAPV